MSDAGHRAGEPKPAVSVIMVCYNGSDLLPESLASLLAQTFGDWELVFWDNGSTDGGVNLARAFDTRVRVFGGPERLTLGAARGKAISEARGDLIAFLDHDDLWTPNKLESQVAFMSRSDVGLCYSDCSIIGQGGAKVGLYSTRSRPREGQVRQQLLVDNFIPTVTVVMTREAYELAGPYDPSLNMTADYDQWIRVARGSLVGYQREVLGSYRLSASGLTSDLDDSYAQVDALYERLLEGARDAGERAWVRRGRARHLWMWALRGAGQGARSRATLRRLRAGWRAHGGGPAAALGWTRFALSVCRSMGVRLAMENERRRSR